MSYCPNCGAETKENEKFCGNCGTKLEEILPAQESNEFASDDLSATVVYTGDRSAILQQQHNEHQQRQEPVRIVPVQRSTDYNPSGQSTVEQPQSQPYQSKVISCPKCGGRHLQMISESKSSTVSTGGGYSGTKGCLGFLLLGPLGILCGNCGSKQKVETTTDTTHFWVCLDCGEKFFDPDELFKQVITERKSIKAFGWLTGFTLIAGLFLIMLGSAIADDFISVIGWIGLASSVIYLVLMIKGGQAVSEHERQYQEIERKMRNNE